jgi:hypothetical protein
MTKHGVMSLTISRVLMGTWLAVSLHWRNMVEGETRMIEICAMSSVAELHVAELKTCVRSTSTLNKSDMKRGTIITRVPNTTNLMDSIPPKEGTMQEESKPFPTT